MAHEIIRLRVFRFDPAEDQEPRFVEYELEKDEKMSVLSALQYIYENIDGTLSLNGYFCYRRLCTLCLLRINGKERLSCRMPVADGMTIEPVKGFPHIKDLVVDFGRVPEGEKTEE